MAYLVLNGGENHFTWQIEGLQSPFNTTYYISAGISTQPITNDSTSINTNFLVTTVNATSSYTEYYTPLSTWRCGAGTFTLYAWVKAANGKYYNAGSGTVTVSTPRPSDWHWWSEIQSGSEVKISAKEWNSFCDSIHAFRMYKGMDIYYFSGAVSGMEISAAICNQAWEAIDDIPKYGVMPNIAVKGKPLYASFFTGLSDALNSVS